MAVKTVGCSTTITFCGISPLLLCLLLVFAIEMLLLQFLLLVPMILMFLFYYCCQSLSLYQHAIIGKRVMDAIVL